jgi:hypothetical protein
LANVIELSKVLIERGDRRVFGRRGGRNQTVHEMDLCSSIAIQGVQVNRRTINFDARVKMRRQNVLLWLCSAAERKRRKPAYFGKRVPAIARAWLGDSCEEDGSLMATRTVPKANVIVAARRPACAIVCVRVRR